jgi:hypothetical protein
MLLVGGIAHADPEGEEPPPRLTFDPVPRPWLDGFGGTEGGGERVTLTLDPETQLLAAGHWWENQEGRLPAIDLEGRGWNMELQLSRDFGWAKLVARASMNHAEGRYAAGTHFDATVALTKVVKLSRYRTIWFSLGGGVREWFGEGAPASERVKVGPMRRGGYIGVSMGGTFR